MRWITVGCLMALSLFAWRPASAAVVDVNIELALLVDVSGSVDDGEFKLQMQGYSAAFRSADIQNLIIDNASKGGVAVNMILWSNESEQMQAVSWTLLKTAQDANDFADQIDLVLRPFDNLTAPGSAIRYATFANTPGVSIFDNGYNGQTLIVDVSGDGKQNDGYSTALARDMALQAGVDRINGLAIGDAGLYQWYQNNIQGGTKSFTIQANDFNVFQDAVKRKLAIELKTVPEPHTALVFLGLAAAFGGVHCRRRRRRVA